MIRVEQLWRIRVKHVTSQRIRDKDASKLEDMIRDKQLQRIRDSDVSKVQVMIRVKQLDGIRA